MLDFNLNEPPIILQVSQATREAISCLVQNANPKDTVWRDDKEQIISSGERLIIQQVSLLALRQEEVTPTFVEWQLLLLSRKSIRIGKVSLRVATRRVECGSSEESVTGAYSDKHD